MTQDARCQAVIRYFETLTPASLATIEHVYAPDASFVDPFNRVGGVAAIRGIYVHMFATLHTARFEVLQSISEGDQSFLIWNFHVQRRRSSPQSVIHGATHLRFAPDGRIALHRDYWDPAQEIYETVPLLGTLMRAVRARLATPKA